MPDITRASALTHLSRLAAIAHESEDESAHDGDDFALCGSVVCRRSAATLSHFGRPEKPSSNHEAVALLDQRVANLTENLRRRWSDDDATLRAHAVRIEGLERGQASIIEAFGSDDEDPAARVAALEQRMDDLVEGFRKVEELEARQRVLERAVAAKGFKA